MLNKIKTIVEDNRNGEATHPLERYLFEGGRKREEIIDEVATLMLNTFAACKQKGITEEDILSAVTKKVQNYAVPYSIEIPQVIYELIKEVEDPHQGCTLLLKTYKNLRDNRRIKGDMEKIEEALKSNSDEISKLVFSNIKHASTLLYSSNGMEIYVTTHTDVTPGNNKIKISRTYMERSMRNPFTRTITINTDTTSLITAVKVATAIVTLASTYIEEMTLTLQNGKLL